MRRLHILYKNVKETTSPNGTRLLYQDSVGMHRFFSGNLAKPSAGVESDRGPISKQEVLYAMVTTDYRTTTPDILLGPPSRSAPLCVHTRIRRDRVRRQ